MSVPIVNKSHANNKTMKNTLKKFKYNYHDKNWINKFLKLLIGCIVIIGIRYVFNSKNTETSDFIFSILFGITIWTTLIIQKKI